MNQDIPFGAAEMLSLGKQCRNYNRGIAELIARFATPNARVLDFGAGIGTLTDQVRDLSLNPLCLEPDAQQRAILIGRGYASVSSLDEIANGSLDYIYSSNVLEHIENDLATLRSLHEKLAPSGRLFLYLPAFQMLYATVDREIGHYRRYNRDGLRRLLRDAGFEVKECFYADFLGFFVALLYKLIANRPSAVNATSLTLYDRIVSPVTHAIERVVRFPIGKNVVAVADKYP